MPLLNKPQASEIVQHISGGSVRPFVQWYATPADVAEYYGRMNITDNIGQTRAESDIVEVPSDTKRDEWIKIAEVVKSLGRGSSAFTQLADADMPEAWLQLLQNNTEFTLHLLFGDKTMYPQDSTQWRSRLLASRATMTEVTWGEAQNPQTADDNASMVINGSFNFYDIYNVGTIGMSQLGSSVITKAINDARIRGTSDNRTAEVFGITTVAAATTPSAIIYGKVTDDSTFTETDITDLATDEEVVACELVGEYLVMARKDSGNEAYYYSTLDDIRAANDVTPTVATGFVTDSGANAIHSVNYSNTFFAGDGGYVYKLERIGDAVDPVHAGTLTTQDLSAIHAYGQQIIAVGASSAMIASDDLGATWYTVTPPTGGLTINTVFAFGKDQWIIGNENGTVYYTLDGGTNWTQKLMPSTVTAVNQLRMYGGNQRFYFGLMGVDVTSAGAIYRTLDSGNTWNTGEPDLVRFSNVFGASTPIVGVEMLNQNEMIAWGGTTLGYGINN